MLKEHKVKIDAAIKVCEDAFTSFSELLAKKYVKDEANKRTNFLLENTFFAGGLFRSIFTDTKVNDIDVFFKSYEAALEFKHMFYLDEKVFNQTTITKNETFNWYSKEGKKLSFNTQYAGKPFNVISEFDFSFNRHYFDLNSFTMHFDKDTFKKMGSFVNILNRDEVTSFRRACRFQNEGFKISTDSMMYLAAQLINKNSPNDLKVDGYTLNTEKASDGDKIATNEELPLTGTHYTDNDYLNVGAKPKAAKKMTIDIEAMTRQHVNAYAAGVPLENGIWQQYYGGAATAGMLQTGGIGVNTVMVDDPEEDAGF